MRPLLLLAIFSVSSAWSWDATGHKLVASIAFQNLNASAKSRLLVLLQHHPKYSCWTAGIPAGDTDQLLEAAMREAAVWPDSIKALTTRGAFPLPIPDCYTAADRTANLYDPTGGDRYTPGEAALAGRNIGYSDHLMHKYWHFDDLPFATSSIATKNPAETINAAERIALFREALKNPDNSAGMEQIKSYDAVWLIHLVGDAHQPLHSVSRYLSATDKGDGGANAVKLTGDGADLHAYWDHLPDHMLTSKLVAPDPAAVKLDDPVKWAQESFALAKSTAYVTPVLEGLGPYQLTPAYQIDAMKIAYSQISLAGYRLAELFNSVLQ